MKTLYSTLAIIAHVLFFVSPSWAQCPEITCPTNINVNNDPGECGAVVNFTTPEGIDPCTSGSQTFNFTGSVQTFTVPTGVTEITVDVYGAQGGANWVDNVNFGGHVQADLAVSPGTVLNIYVGEQPNGINGGWNGGGNGENAGQGGGGASDIRIGGTTLNERVIVAGGAGGAGFWSGQHVVGGLGGGLIGGQGYRGSPADPGGDPGTQTSSGNGTCVSFNNPVVSGGFGFGGSPSGCSCEGYGGGGGWYGGAGSGNCRGGGGGSSYTDPIIASNITHNQGVRVGNGEVTITWSGGQATTTQTAGLVSGSTFPVGITTQTFEAVDGFGNTATCSFTIEVVDNEDPTITAPGAVAVSTDASSCEATGVALGSPVTADNCSVNSVTNDAPASFPTGTTTVTWTVTDDAGNSATATQTVTVTDDENPTITAPNAVNVSADASSCEATGVALGSPVTADNCSVNSVTNDAPASFPTGTTTVTWTVTDDAGNSATATQTVTVTDDEDPVISDCPSNISTVANTSGCEAIVSWTAPTAMDNCTASLSETISHNSGDSFPLGITNVSYEYQDDAGNTSTCAFTVEVINDLIASATSTEILSGNDGTVDLTVSGGTPNYTFSWEGPGGFTSTDQNLTDLDTPGLYTVTITDDNGCEFVLEIFVESRVGLDQIDINLVNVYPNPNNGAFTVDFGGVKEQVSIQVIDAQGRIVKQQTFTNTDKAEMNLDAQKGVYSIRLNIDGLSVNKKISLQ